MYSPLGTEYNGVLDSTGESSSRLCARGALERERGERHESNHMNRRGRRVTLSTATRGAVLHFSLYVHIYMLHTYSVFVGTYPSIVQRLSAHRPEEKSGWVFSECRYISTAHARAKPARPAAPCAARLFDLCHSAWNPLIPWQSPGDQCLPLSGWTRSLFPLPPVARRVATHSLCPCDPALATFHPLFLSYPRYGINMAMGLWFLCRFAGGGRASEGIRD